MKSRWEAEITAGVAQLEADAKARKAISATDPVADGIAYAASEFKKRLESLTSPGRELTPAEWAAEQDPPVTEQSARNWIRRGELAARETSTGYLIIAGTQRIRAVA